MFLCNDAEKLPGTFEVVLECFMQSHTQQLHTCMAGWFSGSHTSDVRHSKLLSGSASCDLCKSPTSILQKQAIGELYPVVPVSSCAL